MVSNDDSSNISTGNDDVKVDVGTGPAFNFPLNIILTKDKTGIFATDTGLKAVHHIDLATGNRTIISSGVESIGAGPSFRAPVSLAMNDQAEKDTIYVVDEGIEGIVKVNTVTGGRTIVSSSERGGGEAFVDLRDAVVADDGSILVTDMGLPGVFRVNPVTGDRTVVSGGTAADGQVGNGPAFLLPAGITLLPESKGDFLMMDPGSQSIVKVTASVWGHVTGDREIVSGHTKGEGLKFAQTRKVIVASSGDYVASDLGHKVLCKIDPITGDRRVISGPNKGAGTNFVLPYGIAPLADDCYAIMDRGLEGMLHVDGATGDRRFISTGRASSDTGLSFPCGQVCPTAQGGFVVVDAGLGGLVSVGERSKPTLISRIGSPRAVTDVGNGYYAVTSLSDSKASVILVDKATGQLRTLSGGANNRGDGPTLLSPRYITTMSCPGPSSTTRRDILVGDSGQKALIRIDEDGNRHTISGHSRGKGPSFQIILGIEECGDGGFMVADTGSKALIYVDRGTGDRSLFSCEDHGSGPAFLNPTGMARLGDGSFAVIDDGVYAVILVEPTSGNRTILSCGGSSDGGIFGEGPSFSCPFGIGYDDNLLVADAGRKALVKVAVETGDRILVSCGAL